MRRGPKAAARAALEQVGPNGKIDLPEHELSSKSLRISKGRRTSGDIIGYNASKKRRGRRPKRPDPENAITSDPKLTSGDPRTFP